jgi:hypothetical protein
LRTDVADIKVDVRSLRDKVDGIGASLNAKIDAVAELLGDKIDSARTSALMLHLTVAAAILGVMARGFGWI